MKEFSEIKWSEVARKAIEQRVGDLEELNRLSLKSKLSSKDVDVINKLMKLI
ncbi:hypothetical protein HYY72_02125 [Candidatus Woesearchaeota archaeon]|nr:hypothetical protein [Candidatus Woesearchaeota archaeon]